MSALFETCPICGKRKAIMWPEFWVWRRGDTFYCSEMCLETSYVKDRNMIKWVYQKRKEATKMGHTKITLAQKKQAVKIAIDGGDPLAYLENLGSKRPDGIWYTIKEDLKKVDPETYAKIPDYRGKTRKPAEKPATVKVDGALRIETPEAEKIEIVEAPEVQPMTYDGMEVSALRHPDLGEFYFDKKYNSIDWRTPEGDEISLGPAWWKQLVTYLPKIMKLLGVDS